LTQVLAALELKLNRSKFICSEKISVADFCLAALYLDIKESQKPGDMNLKPVFESSNLVPYF
jgi:glutathione S-transferase